LILDREDPTFNARWGHTFNRGRFSVGGGYTRTSVLVSEFDQTGLVFQDGNSTNRYISSNLTYEVTDRISTIFNVRLNKQKYDQSNLTDFKSYITSLQVGYDYSEKLNVYMGAGYSKFLNEQNGQAVLSTQSGDQIMRRLSLGVNYDYSPVMNIGFSAGANDISTGGGGWVATANLNYVPSDYTTLTTSYNRSNTASGLGGFQSSDNINILFTTAVSDFDEIGVSFLWNKNRSLNTNTTKQFNAFYTHIISPNWSAIAAFNHRYGSSSLRDSATGAQINFTLSYNISNF